MRSLFAIWIGFIVLAAASAAPAGPLDRRAAFQPDVYPSERSAVLGLGSPVIEALVSAGPEQLPEGARVELYGTDRSDLLNALARQLRAELPSLQVEIHGSAPPGSDPARIRVEVVVSADGAAGSGAGRSGEVTITSSGAVTHGPVAARYVEKAWADDWSAFINAQPEKRWILARGDAPAVSEAEAVERARGDAAAQLAPRVRERMQERSGGRALVRVNEQWVVGQVRSQLHDPDFVADQFVQRFERPYGEVWQAAMLVDASPSKVDQLARRCSSAALAQFEGRAMTWGAMGGFVLVLFLLYLLVNALTRGYFLWRLRAAALLLGIVGILIVLGVR